MSSGIFSASQAFDLSMVVMAVERTREVFWDFEPALEVLWYVAAFSVLVFAYGVARPIAKYRRARGGGWPPLPRLPGRFREAVGILLSHVSIKRRDAYVGWAHRGIFYGFVVLFIGTVILAINTDFTEPVFCASSRATSISATRSFWTCSVWRSSWASC